MIYVYRRSASEGARLLAEEITGNARRINDLSRAHFGNGVRAGDTVICWGERYSTNVNGIRVLNGTPVLDKFQAAVKLKEAGVPTIEVSRTKPVAQPAAPVVQNYDDLGELRELAEQFAGLQYNRTSPVYRDCVRDLEREFGKFYRFLQTPVPVAPPVEAADWIGRANDHVGGLDLLTPPRTPDFFVKKLNIVEEYRIHSFNGKSIRAGVKVKRDGVTAHPWIRSYDGGWKIKYDEFQSKKAMRELAHNAVKTLGLQFGAVDLGKTADGKLVVLEVNSAPGLEGGTVECYAKAVSEWIQEG